MFPNKVDVSPLPKPIVILLEVVDVVSVTMDSISKITIVYNASNPMLEYYFFLILVRLQSNSSEQQWCVPNSFKQWLHNEYFGSYRFGYGNMKYFT